MTIGAFKTRLGPLIDEIPLAEDSLKKLVPLLDTGRRIVLFAAPNLRTARGPEAPSGPTPEVGGITSWVMPADFYRLRGMWRHNVNRGWETFTGYRLSPPLEAEGVDGTGTVLLLNRPWTEHMGDLLVEYEAYPEPLPGLADNSVVTDLTELDIPVEAENALLYFVASQIMRDEEEYTGLYAQFQGIMANLMGNRAGNAAVVQKGLEFGI